METPGIFSLRAKTISDAWFQLVYNILQRDKEGNFIHAYPTGIIQKGSFAGEQSRLQFPGVAILIEYPLQDRIVTMPEGSGIPNSTDAERAEKYFVEKILGAVRDENETYTYGERINISLWDIIEDLKKTPVTNQATIEIARPEDYRECADASGGESPPCLRVISLKVRPAYNEDCTLDRERSRLDMTVYMRSWCLYSGVPENLYGFSRLQEFISDEIKIPVGALQAFSDGLHLYKYSKELAEMRTRINGVEF